MSGDDYILLLVQRIKREERERLLGLLRDRLAYAEQVQAAATGPTTLYASGQVDALTTAIEALDA